MASTVSGRLQPSTMDRMTAGAAMITPALRPRDIKKSRLASARVRASKRRSRYSYAVNTRARWKNGTSVSDRMIIASGRPK